MNKHKLEYFDWADIQSEICRSMNIKEEYFRDYHKLVGGEYKDLWHEWVNYLTQNLTMDAFVGMI